MKRTAMVVGLLAVSVGVSYVIFGGAKASAKEKKDLLRVGVYDSRAITIAYCHSGYNDSAMAKKSKEKHKAEQDGDLEKVEKIEKWMTHFSIKRHSQGFSTAPVHDLLKCIKKQIPKIAADAGVDVIVSKWEFDYLASDAEVVDVTKPLVKAYDPKPRALTLIEQIKNIKPISQEEIVQLELEGGH